MNPAPVVPDELEQASRRKGGFLQALRAVGWSFFGVRNSSGLERDASELNPLHVVVAGVLGALLVVVLLLLLVDWVVGSGAAR